MGTRDKQLLKAEPVPTRLVSERQTLRININDTNMYCIVGKGRAEEGVVRGAFSHESSQIVKGKLPTGNKSCFRGTAGDCGRPRSWIRKPLLVGGQEKEREKKSVMSNERSIKEATLPCDITKSFFLGPLMGEVARSLRHCSAANEAPSAVLGDIYNTVPQQASPNLCNSNQPPLVIPRLIAYNNLQLERLSDSVTSIDDVKMTHSRQIKSRRRRQTEETLKCSQAIFNIQNSSLRPPQCSYNVGWWSVMFLMAMLLPTTMGLPAIIRIGAILTEDQRDSATELAFKYAVYQINNDRVILPNTTLVFDIQYVPRDDSFHTAKKACKQITFGVQAMFGPFDPLLGSHIQSITDALDIPHLEARMDIEPQEKEFSINLFPSHIFLNQAYKDMIQFLKWKKVAIVYEEDFGLMKLQEIIRSPPSKNVEMYIRQGHPDNYRDILKEVKHKEIFSIIVDTLPRNMRLFLRCLLQLQMNDYRYHYLFTTFDIETFDLEDFKYNYVNMTAFRIVDTSNSHVRKILHDMEKFQPFGHSILNKSSIIKAEPALIYDSVNVFAKGLHALERSATLSLANLSCENEKPWGDGSSLFNYINAVEYDGLTGPIKFTEGKRSNFKLDILKLRNEELIKVGEWTPERQINITDRQAFFEGGRPNITLKIITIEETPFVMTKLAKNMTGNGRYEGFCVDLIRQVSTMAGFEYEIVVSGDGLYGLIDTETGEWNGLVRDLIDKKADLAVGSMTINYARESVIDFTKPFMNLGISILFKIPTSQPTRLFSFMNPLAVEIWLYVLAAYVLVSFTMFVMARFSPYEWNNPHPCNAESDVVENQFSVSNSFWFITGTLLRQGSGLNPKAASTRIVGGIWWFFTLIIISSYTANLAAFLTVERMITPIESAEDLAEQSEIEYGTLEGGSTMAFFRDSKIETYQKMWRYMESKRPSVFVPTIEDGVKRVLQGNYAFLMESTMLDYTIQRNCNLTQVGGLLNSNSYGIATPIGSPWRDKISLAILELQEKGVIQMLYSKWWKNTGDVCNRDEKNKDSKANALGVENIGGVFVVLMCGLALAIVVAILEFCWNSRKNANSDRYSDDDDNDEGDDKERRGDEEEEEELDEKGEKILRPRVVRPQQQSLCSEMAEELRFAMRCQGSRQRPALKRNCSRCAPGTTYVPAATDLPQANGVSAFFVSPGSCSSHRHSRGTVDNASAAADTDSLPTDITPPPPAPPPPFSFPSAVPSTYGSRQSSIPLPLPSSSLTSLPPPPSPLSCS
ncbi:glutamate receptor ionotropic, kainate 2 isoform X4 [Cherax quadricarinatus]|uniref:glutamate receptor ionotropic, kainate 2 isoform X4 n=1 Tax=Cherax quadricarinatus TaxID=27406 RepID=UPI00387E4AD5